MRSLLVLSLLFGCGRVTEIGVDAGEADAGEPELDAAAGPNFAFVTVGPTSGDFGGLAGADALCKQQASDADLPGAYIAWLSTSSIDARNRIVRASGWVRPDGLPVAATVDDLVGGRMLYPIDIAADGTRQSGRAVWTGTATNGRSRDGSCGDWSDDSSGTTTVGLAGAGPVAWTQNGDAGCSRAGVIYCFGVDRAAEIEAPTAAGRTMFVSTGTLLGSAGVAAFDATCASEAAAAGLSGNYLALVGRPVLAASGRFDLGGMPWFRPDGVQIVSSAVALAESSTVAPIAVTAGGAYITARVWTGSSSFGEADTNHCDEWTDPAATATLGIAERTGRSASAGATDGCSTQHPVYCAEE